MSALAQFQDSRRNTAESALAGSPSFELPGSPSGGSPAPLGSPAAPAAPALSPAATPRTAATTAHPAKPALASAVSDAAALAAAARLQRMPTHAGDALAGAIAGDSLTENQKRLLAAVDVDYLHSFRCGCRAQLQRAAAVKFRPPCLPRALAVPACSRRRPALPRITCAPGFPARSFDALAMPAQLLPAYVVSMFLELELAHFGWATVFTHLAATQLECG